MPGQNLRLYDITPKVNERADGKSCSAYRLCVADRARRVSQIDALAACYPLQFASGLLSLLELFFDGVGENL